MKIQRSLSIILIAVFMLVAPEGAYAKKGHGHRAPAAAKEHAHKKHKKKGSHREPASVHKKGKAHAKRHSKKKHRA